MFIARSLSTYSIQDSKQELSDEIILPAYHINILMSRFSDDEVLLLNMTNTENNLTHIVAFGQGHNYDKNTIFVPDWILEHIGHSGFSDVAIRLNKIDSSVLPIANKIIIKPLDPIAFQIDTSECFEKVMMNLHTITEGITIPVNIPEFDKNFSILAYIEKVEPAPTSRIVDGEVEVEFINEFVTPDATALTSAVTNDSENSPINQILTNDEKPETSTSVVEELSSDERKRQVRESWLKRFQNNA